MLQSVLSIRKDSWSIDYTPGIMARSMFFYVQSTGHFNCKPEYMTDRQDYNTMLLIYTLNGKGFLRYRDQAYILNPGQGFLIDCMDHQYYSPYENGDWDFKWLHFNGCESRSYFERIYENHGPVFELDSNSIIPGHMEEITRMIKERDYRIDAISSSRIVDMLTELLMDHYKSGHSTSDAPDFIRQAIIRMEDEFSLTINLDTLASQVGVSKYHLSRVFKKYTGYSPYEYVLNYRLSQSKSLLKSTDLPVYTIADKVGFDSSSHFIKLFRKHEGITPLKFREYWR